MVNKKDIILKTFYTFVLIFFVILCFIKNQPFISYYGRFDLYIGILYFVFLIFSPERIILILVSIILFKKLQNKDIVKANDRKESTFKLFYLIALAFYICISFLVMRESYINNFSITVLFGGIEGINLLFIVNVLLIKLKNKNIIQGKNKKALMFKTFFLFYIALTIISSYLALLWLFIDSIVIIFYGLEGVILFFIANLILKRYNFKEDRNTDVRTVFTFKLLYLFVLAFFIILYLFPLDPYTFPINFFHNPPIVFMTFSGLVEGIILLLMAKIILKKLKITDKQKSLKKIEITDKQKRINRIYLIIEIFYIIISVVFLFMYFPTLLFGFSYSTGGIDVVAFLIPLIYGDLEGLILLLVTIILLDRLKIRMALVFGTIGTIFMGLFVYYIIPLFSIVSMFYLNFFVWIALCFLDFILFSYYEKDICEKRIITKKVETPKEIIYILTLIRIAYPCLVVILVISMFSPYYLGIHGIYLLIYGGWLGLIFIIISIVLFYSYKIHLSLLLGFFGCIFIGINFSIYMIIYALNLISSINTGSFEIGFYIGFLSWIIIIIMNILSYKYREILIKSY